MNDTATVEQNAAPTVENDGWEWAIVEIFRHRKHAGRAREEERFGAKMLRIDIPLKGDPVIYGWETHYYGGSSIFPYTLVEEAVALRANKPYEAPSRMQIAGPDFDSEADRGDYDGSSDQ